MKPLASTRVFDQQYRDLVAAGEYTDMFRA